MKTKLQKITLAGLGLALGLGMTSDLVAAPELQKVMQERGLTEKDVLAAAKTYIKVQFVGASLEKK